MRYRLRTLLIVLAVGPAVLAALLSRLWLAPEPPSVTGQVTYLGQPLSYAMVKFEHGATRRSHIAIASREGSFRVVTTDEPLTPGRHVIRVYRLANPHSYRLATDPTDPTFTTVVRSGANKIDIEL